MALTLDNISTIILKGEHLFADKVYEEFTNAEYSSNSDKKGLKNKFTGDLYHLIVSLQYRVNHNLIDSNTVDLYLDLERRLGTYIDPYILDPNYSPPAGTIVIPGDSYKTFLSLLDTPDSYTAAGGYVVTVDSSQTGLIFINPTSLGILTNLLNGLHLDGSIGKLGGTLIEDTILDINNNNLFIGNPTDNTSLQISSEGVNINAVGTDLSIAGIFAENSSGFGVLTLSSQNLIGDIKSIVLDPSITGIIVLDNSSNFGMQYSEDYSALGKLNDLWIPNWGSVKNLYQNGIGYNTGTGYVELGANNLVHNTTIETLGHTLSFQYSTGSSFVVLSLFNNDIFLRNTQLTGGQFWKGEVDNLATSLNIGIRRVSSITGTTVINGMSINFNKSIGITISDSTFSVGMSYFADYHVNNASNPRWIPDKDYVDNAILGLTPISIYFGTGSLLGTGTMIDPYFTNAGNGLSNSDPIYGTILGGNLIKNTTINNSTFTLTFDRGASTNNYLNFKTSGSTEAAITNGGYFFGGGVVALTGSQDSEILTNTTGTLIARSQNDSNVSLKVAQLGNTATGDIVEFLNYARSTFSIKFDGSILHTPLAQSTTSTVNGYNMVGGLKPSNNGDTLIGMTIAPIFGNSTIASWNTLVGGSGYPNGTKNSTVSGGTGTLAIGQAVVSGGIITSFTLISGGINYTIGDVLTIIITDSTGSPMGSGGTITVATITSYTSLTKHSLEVYNGPSKFAPSTNSYQSLIIPTGSSYSGSIDGSIWNDGTHLYAYIGGASRQLDQQSSGGTSTGVNGLSGTTNIGLGGTLIGNTTIDTTSSYQLTIQSLSGSIGAISILSNGGTSLAFQNSSNQAYVQAGSEISSRPFIQLVSIKSGNTQQITSKNSLVGTNKGWFIEDSIDSYGMYYAADYSANYTSRSIPDVAYVLAHAGTGTLTSVTGTTNRITSTGGTTPVIDISSSYIGQSSITTIGTLSSGSIPYSLLTGAPSALPPNGSAGGELAGTYPNPTLLNSAVIGKVLTGYTSGSGTVASTDTILQAIQKLNGNDGLKVPTSTTVAGFALSSNITLAALTATDSTLTFSGSYTGATARTIGINLGNANTWTGLGTFQGGLFTSGNFSATKWAQTSVVGLQGINFRISSSSTYTDNSGSGTTAFMAINSIGIPTVAASSSSTYTNGITLYIEGAPANGTNVTITNPYSLYINAGNAYMGGTLTTAGSISTSGAGISALSGIMQASRFYSNGQNSQGYILSSASGTKFGYIQNTTSDVWSLGYGTANGGTLITNIALKWDGSNNVNLPGLTASKVVFTDASKNLTSTGIGTSSQFIAGDGSLVTIGQRPHNISTPTTGGTVNLTNNQYNIINPAGTLVALTVNLPSSPSNNDSVYIKYTQSITTVTYGNGTVVDGITAPTAGGLVILVYDSGTTSWY